MAFDTQIVVTPGSVTTYISGNPPDVEPAPFSYSSLQSYYNISNMSFTVSDGGYANFSLALASFISVEIGFQAPNVGPIFVPPAGTPPPPPIDYDGSVHVTGVSSLLNTNTPIDLGYNAFGALTVADGGLVEIGVTDPAAANAVTMGVAAEGTGVLDAVGSGARFLTGGNIDVGYLGRGSLSATSGGSIDVLSIDLARFSGSDGDAMVDGEASTLTTSSSDPDLGAFLWVGNDGSGTLKVSNQGHVSVGTTLSVANGAGTGKLTIESGGTVTTGTDISEDNPVTGDMHIGDGSGGDGDVKVTGADSTLTVGTFLSVGDAGHGSLEIEAGGTVSTGADAHIATQLLDPGITDSITVTGAGSSLKVGTFLGVGESGDGTLLVDEGAKVSIGTAFDVAFYQGSTGTATVTDTGSTLTVGDFADIAQDGTGRLSIAHQAQASITNQLVVGGGLSGVGTVDVAGDGTTLSVGIWAQIGSFGDGTLNVESGAKATFGNNLGVAEFSGSTGTVVIGNDNEVSDSQINADSVTVGASGTGTLTVQLGTSLKATSFLIIGSSSGSTGTVDVTSSSTLFDDNWAQVGGSGTGTLTVEKHSAAQFGDDLGIGEFAGGVGHVIVGTEDDGDSAKIIAKTSSVGNTGTGTLDIAHGATFTVTGTFGIGNDPGAKGDVTVDGTDGDASPGGARPSELDAGDDVTVGRLGTATLSVSNGAIVKASTAMIVGKESGGKGTVTVTGSAAATDAGGNPTTLASKITVSTMLKVGAAGDGTFNVESGGNATAKFAIVGSDNSGTGAIALSGAGSQLTVNTDSGTALIIGDAGKGSVTVSDGATLTASTSAGAYGTIAVVAIGNSASGTGTLDVTGAGTTVTIGAGGLLDGVSGSGGVTVEAGGSLQVTDSVNGFIAGVAKGAKGAVSVSGAGAQLGVSGLPLVIGSAGIGSLDISDSGQVNAGRFVVALQKASDPSTVTIDGDGSGLNVAGQAFIGDIGTGKITVSHSGAFAVATELVVGNAGNGTLTLQSSGTATVQGAVTIGELGGSTGTVTVTDPVAEAPSSLKYGTFLIVGAVGKGTLTVDKGATVGPVNDGNGIIEVATQTGSGSIKVDGADSKLDGAKLEVGGTQLAAGGKATVTLSDGGLLDAETSATIWGKGSVVMKGGTFITPDMTIKAKGNIAGFGTISGGSVAGSITNDGFITAENGTLTITDNVISDGGGRFNIAANSTLEFSGTVDNKDTIKFVSGSSAILLLDSPGGNGPGFDAKLVNFSAGDFIDINNFAATTDSFSNGFYTLSDGSNTISLNFGAGQSASSLSYTTTLGGATVVETSHAAGTSLHIPKITIQALTPQQIASYGTSDVVAIQSDASVSLTADQALALAEEGIQISAPDGDSVSVEGGPGIIADLTPDEISSLEQDGVTDFSVVADPVDPVDPNDGNVGISADKVVAMEDPVNIHVAAGSTATLTDTAANIEALTPDEISKLSSIGFEGIVVTDGSLSLTVDQGLALLATGVPVTVPDGDEAVVFDPTALLDVDQIAGLAALHVTDVACYCRGTMIMTENGEVAVETLSIGTRLATRSGAMRPIKWIGRRSYGERFLLGQKHILPICIKAGALDEGVPRRDLWISPHHAMYLEGVLIEARDLVNGVSIVQAERVEKVEYFHIELDTHDVIIAEGSLSETFVDDNNRGMFHNAHEYPLLYPEQHQDEVRYCAPRCDSGYEVESARQRIERRAGLRPADVDVGPLALRGHIDRVTSDRIEGWAQNPEYPETPVCLDIYAGGRMIGQTLANRYRQDLEVAGLGSGRHSFIFVPVPGAVVSGGGIQVRRSLDGARIVFSRSTRRAQPRYEGIRAGAG